MAKPTIADKIEEAAIDGIHEVEVDGTTVEAMSIGDQIKADKYIRQQAASAKNHGGLTFRTLRPGGTG